VPAAGGSNGATGAPETRGGAVTVSAASAPGVHPPSVGTSTATGRPSTTTRTDSAFFGSVNANCLISGDADGRAKPGPVVPGDQEVPAGAISRAKMSSARLSGWFTAIRISTSRAFEVRACGP